MHGVVCLCVDLLFVCEMAVGNVLCCAVMVGVYVHALAFVDVRAIFMWCACCMCVHVLCMCADASGVWLAFACGGAGRACGWIVRVSHGDDGRS